MFLCLYIRFTRTKNGNKLEAIKRMKLKGIKTHSQIRSKKRNTDLKYPKEPNWILERFEQIDSTLGNILERMNELSNTA